MAELDHGNLTPLGFLLLFSTFSPPQEAFPIKTYHLRAAAAQPAISAYYHRQVGPIHVRVGGSTSLLAWWNTQSYFCYDGVSQLEAYGIGLPVDERFLAELFQQLAFRQLDYARPTFGFAEEVGVRWQRYTLLIKIKDLKNNV